jgi:hypothetical protein
MPKQFKKPFAGPLKHEKPFLPFRQPPSRVELAFYEGYDPDFLAKKASALFAAYQNPKAFADFASLTGWPLDPGDSSFFGALATELHCATFHQYEGMLALLLAEYQDRPDWVYLSSYGTKEIKDAAKAIVDERFEAVTNGANHTAEEFVATAVYATWKPTDVADTYESWRQSVRDVGWFIVHCAEMYIKGVEYNAYKHGLRVVSGSAALAARSTAEASGFKTILAMRHSLSYLDLDDTPEGYVAEEVTLELSPEYSYEHIRIAAGVLSTIRDMRIARLKGRAASLNLFSIDRNKLSTLKPVTSMSFSY